MAAAPTTFAGAAFGAYLEIPPYVPVPETRPATFAGALFGAPFAVVATIPATGTATLTLTGTAAATFAETLTAWAATGSATVALAASGSGSYRSRVKPSIVLADRGAVTVTARRGTAPTLAPTAQRRPEVVVHGRQPSRVDPVPSPTSDTTIVPGSTARLVAITGVTTLIDGRIELTYEPTTDVAGDLPVYAGTEDPGTYPTPYLFLLTTTPPALFYVYDTAPVLAGRLVGHLAGSAFASATL